VAQPLEEIVDSVFKLLEERPETPQTIFHQPRLLLRQSTGPVPKV